MFLSLLGSFPSSEETTWTSEQHQGLYTCFNHYYWCNNMLKRSQKNYFLEKNPEQLIWFDANPLKYSLHHENLESSISTRSALSSSRKPLLPCRQCEVHWVNDCHCIENIESIILYFKKKIAAQYLSSIACSNLSLAQVLTEWVVPRALFIGIFFELRLSMIC